MSTRLVSERSLILLVAAVQFVNILDFMMVMPMGPDFAVALGISASKLGYIGGAYTAAAAVSGLAGSFFLDKFDRRPALGVAMLGLVIGTALGGLATGLPSLLAARVLAGMFGGPATSLAFSIIADKIPSERRGKAMGIVMGAFSVASVLGVPAGLELARRGGWRLPFFAVAGLGLVIALSSVFFLPSLRGHLEGRKDKEGVVGLAHLVVQPSVLLSWLMTAVVMMAGFIVVPNISPYVQYNLGYPRARIGLLYLAGGIVSFFCTQIGGRLVDRFGSFRVGTFGSLMVLTALELGFRESPPALPVIGIFMAFMFAMSFRNVSYNTLTTRVPAMRERARFMSIQSAVQHGASASGAFLSAHLLSELPDHQLTGMPVVATLSMALSCLVPIMLYVVETRVKQRELSAGAQAVIAQAAQALPSPAQAAAVAGTK